MCERGPTGFKYPNRTTLYLLYTSLCTGELNAIRKHKCCICSPFYGRACRWAMLGELKPKGPKGGLGLGVEEMRTWPGGGCRLREPGRVPTAQGKACLSIRKHDHFTPTREIKRHVWGGGRQKSTPPRIVVCKSQLPEGGGAFQVVSPLRKGGPLGPLGFNSPNIAQRHALP